MSERGAGLPRWSLSPVEVTARFGDSPNGAADWFGPSDAAGAGRAGRCRRAAMGFSVRL